VTTYIWLGFLGLILLLIGGAFLYGRRSGKDAIAADVASKTADVTAKQAQAQADAPRSKDAIIDRLRNGGGL
jgi:LPXTG-motif cell wall-anchored protein